VLPVIPSEARELAIARSILPILSLSEPSVSEQREMNTLL